MTKPKVLIIDDDPDFRESLHLILEHDYEIITKETGLVGVKEALRSAPDLILLDLKMPDMDGFQTCKMLRSDKDLDHVPIIVISGSDTADERTKVFESGADDFIAKPFENSEVVARIQRKMRNFKNKESGGSKGNVILCGNLKIDLQKQEAVVGSEPLKLSSLELRLLHLLASHSDQVVSRKIIIEKVWEGQPVSERIIDPHIVSLRSKLEGCDHGITSVYGKGYVFKLYS